MSDCCSSERDTKKAACPGCGQQGARVKDVTLRHQLVYPLSRDIDEQHVYFFCATESCNVVYYEADGKQYHQNQVRTPVGQKSHSPDALVCYCFGISRAQIQKDRDDGVSNARDFVQLQTKAKLCACVERNPSGKCCLSDFNC
ncbi:MAG: hypothetical protein OEZ43_03100 [Gammaproteobacteria bacterium]|nr:hypothetical protein [Gammaproteobacteria bacterium]